MSPSYRRPRTPRGAFSSAALIATIFAACASTPTPQSLARIRSSGSESREPRSANMPHEACVDRGGDIRDVDVNGDGRPDVRSVHREGRLFCRESDANFDGRVDITRFFDEQGRSVRVEDDYDFDGRIDSVSSYQNGELAADVLDTNFDGRIDTWRDYRGGHVSELRRDANADGRVDFWETFNEQGVLLRTAVDADGDGEPDPPPASATSATDAGAGTSVSVVNSVDAGTSATPPAASPSAAPAPAPRAGGAS